MSLRLYRAASGCGKRPLLLPRPLLRPASGRSCSGIRWGMRTDGAVCLREQQSDQLGGSFRLGKVADQPFDLPWTVELVGDLVSIVDPSPATDLAMAGALAAEGNYVEAGFQTLGVLPVVGDAIGTLGKYGTKGVKNMGIMGRSRNKTARLSPQKQAGHVPGTLQHANRVKQGKPTSTFFGKKSGERATQIANQRGKPVPGRPNVKEYDLVIPWALVQMVECKQEFECILTQR